MGVGGCGEDERGGLGGLRGVRGGGLFEWVVVGRGRLVRILG